MTILSRERPAHSVRAEVLVETDRLLAGRLALSRSRRNAGS